MFEMEKLLANNTIDKELQELIKIRVSQINGCAFCLNMHTDDAHKIGVDEKRIYLLNAWDDTDIYSDKEKGVRVLTDRVWPRGVSKEDANLDHWLKEVAPTSDLRKWFNHDPQLFGAFKEKYEKELRENDDQKEAFEELKQIVKESKQDVLLLFAAKDTEHNQAVILKDLLDNQ